MERRGLGGSRARPTSDDGRAAITAAAPDHVEIVRRHVVDLLTPEQLRALDEIATTVLDHLSED